MAAASWAHIHSYKDSGAAIAGAFCPNKFDATSDATWARFAATIAGCTVAASASSNTDTAAQPDRPALAWAAGDAQPPDATRLRPASPPTARFSAPNPQSRPVTDPNDIYAVARRLDLPTAAAANISADPRTGEHPAELTSGAAPRGSIARSASSAETAHFHRCANKQPRSRMKVRTDPERGGQTPLCIGATITKPPTGADPRGLRPWGPCQTC